jgi:Permeases of the drug/metabolite transporter (DMT) superfamily
MSRRGTIISYSGVILATFLWGLSFAWTGAIIQAGVPIFVFIFIRMLVAGVTLYVVSKLLRRLQKVEKEDVKWFLLLALFEPFIYFIGESYGIKMTNSATLASVIVGTIPIFTMISAGIFYREKISWLNRIGILLTLPGVFLFVWKGGNFHADYVGGIFMLLLAIFGSVGYSTVCKRLSGKYNAFTITTWQFLLAALYFSVPFMISGVPQWKPEFLSFSVLKPILALALLCSCLSFLFYTYSISEIGMSRTVVFVSLQPVVSAVAAVLMGQESIVPMQAAGMLVTVFGVILAQWKFSKK